MLHQGEARTDTQDIYDSAAHTNALEDEDWLGKREDRKLARAQPARF